MQTLSKMVFGALATLFILIGFTTQTYALFDAQLAVGSRNASFSGGGTDSSSKASEVQFSLHLSPIPLIPIAGGVYVLKHDYEDDITGTQIGIEAMAWLPFNVANLTLFGKLGIGVSGAYKSDTTDIGEDTTLLQKSDVTSATKMSVGVKWTPLALVSLLAQVDYFTEKWDVESTVTAASVATKTSVSSDVSGSTILVGVEAGL